MVYLKAGGWNDYELIDSGLGERIERFGSYVLVRPDPQAIWNPVLDSKKWQNFDASFKKTSADKGRWNFKKPLPRQWIIKYRNLSFLCKLTPFKHTGVFPEQSAQWDWIEEKIKKSGKQINVLNLFGYTGIASLVAANAGARVTHVDASYPTIGWARENQKTSGLEDRPIRWILDDALRFVQREIRRRSKYDAIIMDPPVFGHGPKGEVWDFNKTFPALLRGCKEILSENPLFLLVNAYAISASNLMLKNLLIDYFGNREGRVESGELVIEERSGKRLLSTGIFARWEAS
jgi:23S rRNA (cytosine1962-C5)-methyltransferase